MPTSAKPLAPIVSATAAAAPIRPPMSPAPVKSVNPVEPVEGGVPSAKGGFLGGLIKPYKEKLDKTIGSINTAAGAINKAYPGVLEQPGAYEKQWNENKDFFSQPTASQDILALAKSLGYFNTPTSSQTAYAGNEKFFNDPTKSAWAYDEMRGSDWYNDPTKANDIFGVLGDAGYFSDPTKTNQFWNQTGSRLSGMTGGQNDSSSYYQQHMANRPDISKEPGLDAYYNTAIERSLEDQQRASAARGQYGSTTAQDMEGRRIAELRGEQANREADYNLARLAEQRSWEGLGGDLANQSQDARRSWVDTLGGLSQGADTANTSRALSQSNIAQGADASDLAKMLGVSNITSTADAANLAKVLGQTTAASTTDEAINNRVKSWSDLGTNADQNTLTKIISGLSGAQTSQNMYQDRVRLPLQDIGSTTSSIESILGPAFSGLFGSDQDILESLTSLAGGTTKENAGQRTDQSNQALNSLSTLMETMKTLQGM